MRSTLSLVVAVACVIASAALIPVRFSWTHLLGYLVATLFALGLVALHRLVMQRTAAALGVGVARGGLLFGNAVAAFAVLTALVHAWYLALAWS